MQNPQLETAIADFTRAVNERDSAIAGRILDPDYALVTILPKGAVMPRQQWLNLLPQYIVHTWTVEERLVHVHPSGDAAAVLQRVHMKATVAGEDRSGVFVISDMWRRGEGGQWQVWRRHSAALTAGKMPGA